MSEGEGEAPRGSGRCANSGCWNGIPLWAKNAGNGCCISYYDATLTCQKYVGEHKGKIFNRLGEY